MGPHGLCVGATGSGKSRTAAHPRPRPGRHPPAGGPRPGPRRLQGRRHLRPLRRPPARRRRDHQPGEPGRPRRARPRLASPARSSAASRSSRTRATSPTSATTPPCAPRQRPDLDPLPHLFVVIDEFGELLTAKPDFIDLFLSIGRIGRSIGVHLLLSSQRIEGGKLKGLDTYLSYRLGLRTFSADESRTVLDTTDAFHLPPLPGFGYLKVDTSPLRAVQGELCLRRLPRPRAARQAEDTGPLALEYEAFNTLGQDRRVRAPRSRRCGAGRPGRPRCRRHGRPADERRRPPVRRIWLPPLPDAITLDTVAGPVEVGARGMQLAKRRGPLQVPLGILDDPARQWQGQWYLDLTVAGGHAAVIGGPQSGKTTLLRTLALSLALTHTPQEVGDLRPRPGRRRPARPCPGCRTSAASPAAPTANAPPAPSTRYAPCSPAARSSSASTASTPLDQLRTPARRGPAARAGLHRDRAAHRRLRRAARRLREPRRRRRRHPQARRRLRHPRRRRHAPLERRPHRHPVEVRHPRRAATERPQRVQHRPQARPRPSPRTSRAAS